MIRYYIIFKGQIQGVGFRYTVGQIAYKYNLTGYVRNLYDGDVEVELQGNKNNLDQAIREIRSPRRYIIVDDYFIKEIASVDNEKGFSIRF